MNELTQVRTPETLSSLRSERDDQHYQPRKHSQEPATTHSNSRCGKALFSLTEEYWSKDESLTCWICQEELSSKRCLIQHYHEHMR